MAFALAGLGQLPLASITGTGNLLSSANIEQVHTGKRPAFEESILSEIDGERSENSLAGAPPQFCLRTHQV